MIKKILQKSPFKLTKGLISLLLFALGLNLLTTILQVQIQWLVISLRAILLINGLVSISFNCIKGWQWLILKQQLVNQVKQVWKFHLGVAIGSTVILTTNWLAWLMTNRTLLVASQILLTTVLLATLFYQKWELVQLIQVDFAKLVAAHFQGEIFAMQTNEQTPTLSQRIAKLNQIQLHQIAKQLEICAYQDLEIEQLRAIIRAIYLQQAGEKNA